MTRLFDSHAHYNDSRFDDYPGGAAGAIKDSFDSGVCGIMCVGTLPETSAECIALAEAYDHIYVAAGIHPGDSRFIPCGGEISALDEIRAMLDHERVLAIGEIGLDYHYGREDEARQKYFFDAQLSLAEETSYPVIIHDREAHGDTLDILKAHKGVTAVLHSFSGSAEMARELCSMGHFISFSGTVSYKSAKNVRAAAAAVPRDRILVETDAPYLPPEPHRGEINLSAYLRFTAAAAADAAGVPFDEFCDITVRNTEKFFGIGG